MHFHPVYQSFTKLVSALDGCIIPTATSTDEEREAFVHSCEQVAAMFPSCYLNQDKLKDVVSTLCLWVQHGLSMDEAMSQAQPVYKIRHLKAGLRLCMCLCQCSDDVTRHLLEELALFDVLVELYHMPHMALSIKLLILRAMDAVLSCRTGVQLFLLLQPKLEKTGYEVTLQLLATTSHTRAKVCAAAILRKLHLLEVLEKLRDDVMNLQSLLPPIQPPLILAAEPQTPLETKVEDTKTDLLGDAGRFSVDTLSTVLFHIARNSRL